MIILTTGDGKGKTTAAVGQAIRALGHGKKVFFAQFIKCDGYPSGEDQILRGLGSKLTFVKGGRGFVGIMGDKLPLAEHRKAAAATLAAAAEAVKSKKYDLIVLDEINVALSLKLIELKEVLALLASVAPETDVVLTGRYAPAELIARADFVTECQEVKHPYKIKVAAKKGIEY